MVAYTRNMNQTATYWAPTAKDRFGQPGYAAPVTVICRWQGKRELVRDTNGAEVMSSAVIYPAEQLASEGWLALGDLTATADPRTATGANKIISTGFSPSLRGDLTLYKVWL